MDIAFNNGWLFTEDYDAGFDKALSVRLPHTAREIPYNYIDCRDYQMVCGYRKSFTAPSEWQGKRLILRFDGAAHEATVFCNGTRVGYHACGYTAFSVDITDSVDFGGENIIDVRLDTRESLNIPPFGFVIDYLCYGGLYREVTLEVKDPEYIKEVLIENTGLHELRVRIESECESVATDIVDDSGKVIASACGKAFELSVPNAQLWSLDSPALHTARVRAMRGGEVVDEKSLRFGFRTVRFENDGFYLNGQKVKLRGLNRHQSYAYVGYAMPKSVQELDAEILKNELGVNAVRTSHYPQSQHFISRCDELGLLVFTELPGWQHIGDEAWKNRACAMLEEMILQNRNHPSIILWGVRINESQDDDAFYTRTNAIAHKLDPSRQTSGVRYLSKSHLLEDVYAFNDFSHNGVTPGVKPKKDVTPDMHKALLISECNGHMYPTKPFDDASHRQEHALRHVRIQNDAAADGEHAGCFGWGMFDYPTHRDFGSGDRVCYHGVLDAFRNPKPAAAVYASQGDQEPVLTLSAPMDIGDYPAGNVGTIYAFSNAEEVRLYKNDVSVRTLAKGPWTALLHPPLEVSDTIGELLETQEGFPKAKAEALKDCLLAAGKYTLEGLPLRYKLKMARCMAQYHMKFSDGFDLYGKYVGNWGGEATRWRFDALNGGKVVKSVTLCPSAKLHLEARPSALTLREEGTYDMAAVRIRILDANGNVAPYAQLPVTLSVTGDLELVGPAAVTAEGGMTGTYVKTTGKAGRGTLTLTTAQTEPVTLQFTVLEEEEAWN